MLIFDWHKVTQTLNSHRKFMFRSTMFTCWISDANVFTVQNWVLQHKKNTVYETTDSIRRTNVSNAIFRTPLVFHSKECLGYRLRLYNSFFTLLKGIQRRKALRKWRKFDWPKSFNPLAWHILIQIFLVRRDDRAVWRYALQIESCRT